MFRATAPAATVINRESNFWSGQQDRVGNIADFCHKYGKGFGKGAAHPRRIFSGSTSHPPGGPNLGKAYEEVKAVKLTTN